MKNKIKQFFGPSLLVVIIKIILNVGLFFSILIIQAKFPQSYYSGNGLPLVFSKMICQLEGGNFSCIKNNYFALIFDFIFWYAVVCFIFLLFNKKSTKFQ